MKFDQETFYLVLLMVAAILVARFMPKLIARGIPFVEPRDLHKRLEAGEDIVVIDVRSAWYFKGRMGHIPGALNLPGRQLKTRLQEVEAELEPYKNHPVFITCQRENTSPRAAKLLLKTGFTDVSIVKGGVMRWRWHKLPLERG